MRSSPNSCHTITKPLHLNHFHNFQLKYFPFDFLPQLIQYLKPDIFKILILLLQLPIYHLGLFIQKPTHHLSHHLSLFFFTVYLLSLWPNYVIGLRDVMAVKGCVGFCSKACKAGLAFIGRNGLNVALDQAQPDA